MKSAPVLSIIVPVLNEAAGISSALAALQTMRQRGVEVIVADGGSTDGTADLARPLVDQLINAPRGRARQMNAGAAIARGRVLLFLHADTRLPAQAYERLIQALAETSGAPVWGRFNVHIDGRSRWLRLIAQMMNLRSRLTGIATGDQAIFVAADAFRKVGDFPDMPLMEDIALSKSLRRISRPVCLTDCVITSGRRWETHGIWRTIVFMWWLRLRYFFGADPNRLAREYGYVTDEP